jgi:[protein-PII] uridylyltransferase
VVQSPERLRLLMILTSVDIAAVGPGTWTAWKRQLLRTLYDRAEETLRLGHKQRGRGDTVAAAKVTLGNALGWTEARISAELDALPEAWWIAEPDVVQCLNARLLAETDPGAVRVTSVRDEVRAGTLVTVAAPDRPGLFHASSRRSARRGATSSTRACTPAPTAARWTIFWCSGPTARRSTTRRIWRG